MLFVEMILFVIRLHELDAEVARKARKLSESVWVYPKEHGEVIREG